MKLVAGFRRRFWQHPGRTAYPKDWLMHFAEHERSDMGTWSMTPGPRSRSRRDKQSPRPKR